MSEIKTRKYKCTGCGEDRPCYLESNQEPNSNDWMQVEELKCVLDETNQTSYNWVEVKANEATTSQDKAFGIASVIPRFYLGQEVQTKDGKGIIVKIEMEWNGLYISPERSIAVVWYSTDDTQCKWVNKQYTLNELNVV